MKQHGRFLLPWLAALVLSGCQSPAETLSDETELAIIEALLASRPDTQADMEEWWAEEPDAWHWSHALYDYRECVAREIVGRVELFEPFRLGEYQKQRDAASERYRLPDTILPEQLRWDHPMSACTSGVLQLSIPEIEGDIARVHVANQCDGWCGWGGIFTLHRVGEDWVVDPDFEAHWFS